MDGPATSRYIDASMSTLSYGAALSGTVLVLFYVFSAIRDMARTRSLKDYFFAGWSLDSTAVGATLFSSSTSLATVVIALLQLTHIFGSALLWAPITFCAGWLLLRRVARR